MTLPRRKSCDLMAGLQIKRDEPLKPYTTFKVGGPASYFASAAAPDDFLEALRFAHQDGLAVFVLGGGSNIVVSDEGFRGLVVHPVQRGISAETQESEAVTLRVEPGEPWDNVVRRAVEEEFWGIENLSHIPGQAGAALVQNIGAYGQQISDVFQDAAVMDIRTGEVRTLGASECRLGYRRSIFNTTAKNEFIILRLTLRLRRRGKPDLRYPDVGAYFGQRGIERPSLGEIREAIIGIRDRKFLFPREAKGGNAGSFFKNVVLSSGEFEGVRAAIQRNFSARELDRLDEMRKRAAPPDTVKVPTAFLIEICGFRGYGLGDAEVNEAHPLVLLNQGDATAHDVLTLAGCIRREVFARTGVSISLEPELVGFTPEQIEKYLALH